MCPHARPDWHMCPWCNGVNDQHVAEINAPVKGWLCPACGRGNAPTLTTCPCADQRVRTADYLGLEAPTFTINGRDYGGTPK